MSTYCVDETHILPDGTQTSAPSEGSERLHSNPTHPLNDAEAGAPPSVTFAARQLCRSLARYVDVSALDWHGVLSDRLGSTFGRRRHRTGKREHDCAGAEERLGCIQHASTEWEVRCRLLGRRTEPARRCLEVPVA